jgi:hypothetical protein
LRLNGQNAQKQHPNSANQHDVVRIQGCPANACVNPQAD